MSSFPPEMRSKNKKIGCVFLNVYISTFMSPCPALAFIYQPCKRLAACSAAGVCRTGLLTDGSLLVRRCFLCTRSACKGQSSRSLLRSRDLGTIMPPRCYFCLSTASIGLLLNQKSTKERLLLKEPEQLVFVLKDDRRRLH